MRVAEHEEEARTTTIAQVKAGKNCGWRGGSAMLSKKVRREGAVLRSRSWVEGGAGQSYERPLSRRLAGCCG
jgi:hypothetical protein